MRTLAWALALLVALAAVAAAPAAAPTSRIVFAAGRAATEYGEIYRIEPNGTVTNLSRSPAADTSPAASPDGKRVAFASVRGGRVRIYAVGSDGRGLRPVSPPLAAVGSHDAPVARITWAPDNRRLGVVLSVSASPPSLYVTSVAGGWRLLAHRLAGSPAAWSREGARVAFATSTGLVDVADARSGRTVWRVAGVGTPAWSRSGRVAVQQSSATIAVYDGRGRPRATFAGHAFAWSPLGDVLASDRAGTLELRSGGTGTPTLRVHLVAHARPDDDAQIRWVDDAKLRLYDNRSVGYDVAKRRIWRLPAGANVYGNVLSANGTVAYVRSGRPTTELVRGAEVVRDAPSCGDELPFEFLQFLGPTEALLYQSGCIVPSADIYSIGPDGTGLQQVTNTPQHEFSPAVGPDGSRVAYVQQTVASRCDGCAQSLWVTAPAAQLTAPKDSADAPFDEDPSWSPDGGQIVYSQSGADSPFELLTIPAAGGTPQKLGIRGSHPAWGPRLIAFEVDGTPPKIETFDPATHATAVVAVTKGRDPAALAWSSDGRLAYLAYAPDAWISIVGGASFDLNRLLPPKSIVTGIAWSPDGTRFAFVATDRNGLGEVYTVATNGTGLRQVTRNAGAVGNLSWR